MQFTMTGFAKSDTIFKAMGEVHSQKGINRHNMVNFQFVSVTANLASPLISLKALLLNLQPKITVSSFSTSSPTKVLFPSHIKPLLTQPITQGISTSPSLSARITTKLSFLGTKGMKLLTALLTNCSNRSSSFRLLLTLHISGIGDTLTLAGATLLVWMIKASKLLATLLAYQFVGSYHTLIIDYPNVNYKKHPEVEKIEHEDVLVFKREQTF